MSSTRNLGSLLPLMETQCATKRSPSRHVYVSQASRPTTSRPHPAAPPQQKASFSRRRRFSGNPQTRSNRVEKRLKIADEEPSFDVEHLFQLSEAVLTFAPFDTPDNKPNGPLPHEKLSSTSHDRRLFFFESLRDDQEAFWNVCDKEAALCLHHKLQERARFLRKVERVRVRHPIKENVEKAQEKILRSVNRIVDGHTNLERWWLKLKYHARRGETSGRRKCSECSKQQRFRPGYEYGDWNFGILEEDGTVLPNPLDELD
ncbi:hypothetical protein H2200_010670 [Cladophialophora chaetospira]|uniref:Uncharacterized protein n=1 Tax=Cladophialophora chaetospira TaxID=386627 RepID=A0AA38X0J0_9EURO|nr:hypothetical protein H2200_010670 [Cladophialophora chaetospira]